MAGASASQSTTTTRGQSTSDTYIPEYSQTPILNEIATHARAMSDQVYSWGMDQFNKAQGDIDSVMRDALSYASPQRIAVDMGMAEAGVQQAAERGRLSAERDLQSYGLDPSAGKYAQLNAANRVMSAAAAAGAGNQQRMADQAAGNAMRQQAISAGLQNRNFGSQVGRDANAFLTTAMSLKYPPLGRTSQSTNATDSQSTSGSVQTDPPQSGGGGKGGGDSGGKQPSGGGGGQPKGGGGGAQPREGGGKSAAPPKPQPTLDKPPVKGPAPKTGGGGKPEEKPEPLPATPTEPVETQPLDPLTEPPKEGELNPNDWRQNEPPPTEPLVPSDQEPLEPPAGPTDEPTTPDTYDWRQDEPAEAPPTNQPLTDSDKEPLEDPLVNETLVDSGYNPYSDNVQQAAFQEPQNVDPITGEPIDEGETVTQDMAGSLYGLGETGGWTGDEGIVPASYEQPADQDAMWSDIGQGTMAEGTEGQVYDSAYDQWTDPGYELPADEGDQGFGDWTDAGDQYGDWGNFDDQYADTDWANYGDQDYADQDYGDQDYEDQYADWGEEDYYNDQDWGEEDYDWGDDQDVDYGEEDYGDEEYDFGEDTDDWTDAGDEEDYGDDENYDDEGYTDEEYDYGAEEPAYDEGGGYDEEESYDEGDGGYDEGGYEEAARGGAVLRGRMRNGKRRARVVPPRGPRRLRRRMPTGYGPRPMRRPRPMPRPNGHIRPAFARGGPIPPQGGMGMDTPPKPPGAALRAQQPQQAPRPMRGAPMAAPGGPRPTPMGRGPRPMPGNFISANGMPPPTGMPQRMAGGGQVREPTTGGFVSRELSPSGGSKVDDVEARLNAGEFVIPKDVSAWKGKEFFYKLIATARKNRSAPNGGTEKPKTGFSNGATPPSGGMR